MSREERVQGGKDLGRAKCLRILVEEKKIGAGWLLVLKGKRRLYFI